MRPTGLLYVLLPHWIWNEVMRWLSQPADWLLPPAAAAAGVTPPPLWTHGVPVGHSLWRTTDVSVPDLEEPEQPGTSAGTAVFSRLVWGRVDEFPVRRARCWAPLRWRDTNIRTGAAAAGAATTERPRWVHSERDESQPMIRSTGVECGGVWGLRGHNMSHFNTFTQLFHRDT